MLRLIGLTHFSRPSTRTTILVATALVPTFCVATTAGQAQVQAFAQASASDIWEDRSAEQRASLVFRQERGRLVATVGPSLLEADFLIEAGVAAVQPSSTGGSGREALLGSAPAVGAQLVSGALRLQRDGDSLALMEYAGTFGGELRYRRRATMPVLRLTSDRALVIDAEPLWAALEPDKAGFAAMVTPCPLFEVSCAEATSASGVSRLPGSAAVFRPMGGVVVDYRVRVVPLPKKPMRPRLADPRVNFFDTHTYVPSSRASQPNYINRVRLEKRDPRAPVSDVSQPVIFRIAESIPKNWVPYVKRAVEKWNSVFESIGFRNALVVRLPGDARPDTTQWEIPIELGSGGGGRMRATADPRSGEWIKPLIQIDRGAVPKMQAQYFGWVGANNPHARSLPLTDSVGGLVIELLTMHEVGHAFGLNHNFKIDGYPTDSLRSPSFLRRMEGPLPSVMGYAWANYMAQPEDNIPVKELHARIGTYDRWMLAWGYRPIPEAATPEDEIPILEQWRTAQDTASYLRGALGGGPYPYEDQTQIVGDDLVKAAEYGINNISRLAQLTQQDASADARRVMASNWFKLLMALPDIIGGSIPQAPYPRDLSKVRAEPIDLAYQVRALQFALAHLVYGQDAMAQQILGRSVADTTLVLFESLAPEWEASQKTWKQPLQAAQKGAITRLMSRKQLGRMAAQASPGSPKLPAAVCQELATLARRLATEAGNSSVPRRQQQAKALHDIVAPVTAPNAGLCS